MFCSLADLRSESDVEQKLLLPMLTTPVPSGFGLGPADFSTKPNIRRIEIGKGASRKLYFPDYVVVLAGLPMLIIEAKAPGEPLADGLAEARLYANEVNASFPTGLNPCQRVLACNGTELLSSPVDTATPDVALIHSDLSEINPAFAKLVELCSRTALQQIADRIRRSQRQGNFRRAVDMVGGLAIQNQELPANTFGATIVGDYGHIFNPQTREDRAFIATVGSRAALHG